MPLFNHINSFYLTISLHRRFEINCHGHLEGNGWETEFLQNNVEADLFKYLHLDEKFIFGENPFTLIGKIYPNFQQNGSFLNQLGSSYRILGINKFGAKLQFSKKTYIFV